MFKQILNESEKNKKETNACGEHPEKSVEQ